MMNLITRTALFTCMSAVLTAPAQAAIALDRTRIIFNGTDKSVSLNIDNKNNKLPYLAQGWIEDETGKKLQKPFAVLPPLQRVEPKSGSQVKIQALPEIASLPQDRESVFFFNLREIPPKSNKPNVLQIALQTRIKLFYRPEAIIPASLNNMWQEKLTLTHKADQYHLHNPSPYYINLAEALTQSDGPRAEGFEPMMVPPKSSAAINVRPGAMGSTPVLIYINDYGGRTTLPFRCVGGECRVTTMK
ncbi:fimbria/pilus periplasmic chaperone [Enterobacter bugandensis]|nr:fimbria/pilus periplasmic chaperone [Enterobacter bugandensis]EKS7120163.1 fimbria/pilus periplasmic chaperone [Enterobacter bugandensis]